ncbi:MAG TPA: hypothetical protein VNS63_25025 [Blastocatellia bacterium]|nr:hypothetical protein [Blastocatellia bacterium]
MPKTGPSNGAAQTGSGAIARDFALMGETPLLRFSGAQEEGRAVKELTARPSKATILFSAAQVLFARSSI